MIFLILISIIYTIYIIWLSEGLNKLKLRINNEYNNPFVSIIIAARNEENNIPNLINAINSQTYEHDKIEIIISNDRSTDNTLQIIKNFVKNKIKIKYVNIDETPLGWGNKKWALNKAIELASGEIEDLTITDKFSRIKADLNLELAKLYEMQGRKEEAIHRYQLITEQFPRTRASAESYYKMGSFTLQKEKDYAEARKYFDNVDMLEY